MKGFSRGKGPEYYIRRDILRLMRTRGWMMEITHGSQFQSGFPDLFAAHPKFGTRWIDAKNPEKYSFTNAQKIKWPEWKLAGVGIWIMTAGNEIEYDKLFQSPNWEDYWKPSYTQDRLNLLTLIDDLNNADD